MSSLEHGKGDFISEAKPGGIFHKCKTCSYATKSSFYFKNHVKWHQSADPLSWFDCSKNLECFICKDCDFITYLVVTFREHIKNHGANSEESTHKQRKDNLELTSKVYILDHCYKTTEEFKKSDLLCGNDDNLLVDNGKWFYCDKCPFKTKHKTSRTYHEISKHASGNIKWYNCPDLTCSYKAKLKSGLTEHILFKHTPAVDIKWFQCDHCQYRAKKKTHLRKHNLTQHVVQEHTDFENIRWFYCDKCPYRSKWNSSVNRHMIGKHTLPQDIKWFDCEHCSYKSKFKGVLDQHKLHKHSPENIDWLQCDKCSYMSKMQRNLKAHVMNQHTEIREARWTYCTRCKYKTKRKSLLRKHWSREHTKKVLNSAEQLNSII